MDAKSRAKFINSVADGSNVPCPKCGASNKSDSRFCISCGAEITITHDEAANSAPAFAAAKETAAPVKIVKYVEASSAFAEGLPSWSIEPPQVMVRRR